MRHDAVSCLTALVFAGAVFALPACGQFQPGPPPPVQIESIRLPAGFRIEVWAENIPGARSLALGADGTVFVGSQRAGVVYAVRGAGGARRVLPIATGLNQPNGVAFHDGDLYVAEISRISRFEDIESRLEDPPAPLVLNDALPADRLHGWKYLQVGPDGKLYFGIGAPCNICEPGDPYASIARMNLDGTGLEVVARGVRNTVGFDWHPETGELWFTDNGRDNLGNDAPPDELNRVTEEGQHFGYPYCHGGLIEDPEFGTPGACAAYRGPARRLGPHVAAIGMAFYTGGMFPEAYRGQIFVAEHGSWNRDTPIGYRLSLVRLEDGDPVAYEPFASGWLEGGMAWGRPVDVLQMPDGSLLVSDDRQGLIYRIAYGD